MPRNPFHRLALLVLILTILPTSLHAQSQGDACSNANQVVSIDRPGIPALYCDGANLQNFFIPKENAAMSCTAAREGALQYIAATDTWNFCNGTAWTALASGSGATTIDGLTDAFTDYATDHNIIMGRASAAALTAGARYNLFIGEGAGATTANSTSATDYNTAVGYRALAANAAGQYNTALGHQASEWNIGGSNNTAVGANALNGGSGDGSNNTALGVGALQSNYAKSESTAIGFNAMLYANGTAGVAVTYNTAVGAYALRGSTTAANNTGTQITAIGHSALLANTSGANGTAVGAYALTANTTGADNTAFGRAALQNNQTGYQNTAVGSNALQLATGNDNTAIGSSAGNTTTTGNSNILIGSAIMAPTATTSNHLNIGGTIFGDVSTDNVRIGGSGVVSVGPLVATPPAAQTIAAGNTIAANACGTIKQINAGSAVTTDTTNTFTAPAGYGGCCMDIVNVDTTDTITLDANANFKTIGGVDQALGPYDTVRVCSDGANWFQMGAVAGNQ
jgi:hypothetical protein